MRVSSLLGRNASCCDFKQLFPRLAGVALHGGTGAKKKQAKIIFGTFMQLPPRVGSYVAFIFARWMAALSIQLDRFGRSLKELLETGEDLNGREINLISLKERIDTNLRCGRVGVPCLWSHCAIRTSADFPAHKRRVSDQDHVETGKFVL